MRVNVRLHSILRDHLPREAKGKAVLELPDGATTAHLLARLKIDRRCIILVNGREIEGETHGLQDGDEVQMVMALGGGT